MVAVMKLFLLTGLLASTLASALALPAPDSPSVRPAGGYALVYATDPAKPLEVTCEALPGYGVFVVIISASTPVECAPAPSCPVPWVAHKDKNAAAWRTNTGEKGMMLVCAADQVNYPMYAGFPTKGEFLGQSVDGGPVEKVTYVVHVIDLATRETFYATPDFPSSGECHGVLLFGWDYYWMMPLKEYLVLNGIPENDIVEVYTGLYDPTNPNPLTKVLRERYEDTGSGFCTMVFDTEYIGPNGQWGGLSADDEAALKWEMLNNGMGLVYAEPATGPTVPNGQLPNILPLQVTGGCSSGGPYQYEMLNGSSPLASEFIPNGPFANPFFVDSVCQGLDIVITPTALYPNPVKEAVTLGNLSTPGVGGTPIWSLDYGANGCRVAVIGTDLYAMDALTSPSPFRLYLNAIKYTGHY